MPVSSRRHRKLTLQGCPGASPGDNGAWHAKALHGKTEVHFTVDARGEVTTADWS